MQLIVQVAITYNWVSYLLQIVGDALDYEQLLQCK